jgi:hypothetical protein
MTNHSVDLVHGVSTQEYYKNCQPKMATRGLAHCTDIWHKDTARGRPSAKPNIPLCMRATKASKNPLLFDGSKFTQVRIDQNSEQFHLSGGTVSLSGRPMPMKNRMTKKLD